MSTLRKKSNSKTVLINKIRNNSVIERNLKFANSYFKRLKGLMFVRELNYGLVFIIPKSKIRNISPKTNTIHSFFMRISVDILFLNENKEVIDMKTLKPWKYYSPVVTNKGNNIESVEISYIIELKEGLAKKNKVNIGDKLDFVCENT
ncbi:MAG: DUF192 domain-containing protein [Methanobacteriaceae archaeon]